MKTIVFLCLDNFVENRRKEVKTLNCGHRLHSNCYLKLAENGIRCSDKYIECMMGEGEQPIQVDVLDAQFIQSEYSNRAILCSICKKITFLQELSFEDAVKYRAAVQFDVVEVD